MAIATFIAGQYAGTLNAVALGITEEGYELQLEPKSDTIERSDAYGDMMLDLIYRGTNYFLQTEFLEYKAGPIAAMQPWNSLGGQGVIGRLGSDVATPLVLTATTGTPAAAAPATLTASLAILAPGSNPRAAFNSRLRTVPVRFVCLPTSTLGIVRCFTTT